MKTLSKIYAAIGLTIATTMAQAESMLPAGAFTNLSADATDTATAVAAAVVPVGVAVITIWSGVLWARKGAKTATRG